MSRPEDCELKSLHDAVESKDLDLLESLLKGGVDPNAVDDKGMTALNFICYQAELSEINLKMIQLLIQYGADVNTQDEYGNSPMMNLFYDESNGMRVSIEKLKLPLKNGANFTRVNHKGNSPMMNLFYDEYNDMRVRLETLKILLKNGADVTRANHKGRTIFRKIILCNPANPDTAVALELLLKNGADPNMIVDDEVGRTALNFICDESMLTRVHLKMIQILLKYKADVNIQDKNGFSPIMNLFRFPENYKLRLKVFKLLLAYGADVTLVDHRGITILYIICHCNAANNPIILEAVELLFKIGIDVNVKNEYGHTALHIAVKDYKDIKVIELLLKNGADPNIVDNWRKTPLHLICAQHYLTRFHLEIIQLLIQYKANVNAQNKDGYSPIMYLLCAPNNYKLHLEVCKLLLENGVDVTLVDHEGNTVLHRIFEYNAEKNPIILAAVKLLIERGVDVNVRNGNGYSALHIAVEYCKDIKVIDLLLKNGADPNIVDNWGLTPLHFLCRRTAWTEVHSKLIQLLIQYKADPHVKSLQNISPIMYLFEHELLSYNEFILFMEIFGLLVKNGTDLKNVDVFSKSMLLHRILRCDHWGYLPEQLVEGLEFLLKNGADVNMKDNNGKTALHQAFHCTKHVAFLLKNGADPNITDVKGNIPLNYTFDNFHRYLNDHLLEHYLEKLLELLKLNVEHNADPSHVGGDGKTVLHSLIEKIRLFTLKPKKADWEAVSKFVHQYMEILLKHGLDVNIKDGDGFTALNLAVSHCNYDVTKILVEHGADANTVQFKGGLLENKEPQSLNLLTTLNVLAIIELWQSKGFRINNYQYLRLFKFLTLFEDSKINNDLHSLLPNFCHNVSPIICDPQWIDNFECGSGSVIRKYVETIFLAINDSSKCTNVNIATLKLVLYKTIKLHLSLVEYGNMYMDIETHNYLRNTLNSLVSEIPEIVQPRIFKGIRDQVDLAKEMIISNNISYLDLCTSSPDKTYSLLQKCDYESALNSEAFRRNFHDIGGIIRGYVIKALVRRFITKSTTDSIKLLFDGILPDLCCDKIVEFLDVIDLVSVFEAVINC